MKTYFLSLLLSLSCVFSITAQPAITLDLFASGFDAPVDIINAGDDRLYVVEREGLIKILDSTNGNTNATPYLDITDIVVSCGGNCEIGLLGLAFHPDFANNGQFYVSYTSAMNFNTGLGNMRVSRFSADDINSTTVEPTSEYLILDVAQPYSNHNGGGLRFGPDGYLYIGWGDGGAANDPNNYAQNTQSMLGKMLRIDVDNGNPYTVPADNPFVGDANVLDEIWAIGLRNPWRFEFDTANGNLWIGDVGQGEKEEVDFEAAGSAGGENYGWRCYEGTEEFNLGGCQSASSYTPPAFEYDHGNFEHCSITGGHVYRGSAHPSMQGWYFMADYCSGAIWAVDGSFNGSIIGSYPGNNFSCFGTDSNEELYVASLANGRIYKINAESDCSSLNVSNNVVNETCEGDNDGAITLDITGGAPPYTISPSNLTNLPAGDIDVVIVDANGCEVTESATISNSSPGTITISQDENSIVAPTGFDNYTWYLDGNVVAGATTSTIVNIVSGGAYHVVVTNSQGCTGSSQMLTNNYNILDQSIKIFPVPFVHDFLLSFEQPLTNFSIQISDASGRVFYTKTNQGISSKELMVQNLDLANGVYFIKIKSDEGAAIKKVVRQ